MIGKERIAYCLKNLEACNLWELSCAASDANWYEMYDAEAILRAAYDRRS